MIFWSADNCPEDGLIEGWLNDSSKDDATRWYPMISSGPNGTYRTHLSRAELRKARGLPDESSASLVSGETELCELCRGSGYYGDNGPGIKGNREYVRCECQCPPKEVSLTQQLSLANAEIARLKEELNSAQIIAQVAQDEHVKARHAALGFEEAFNRGSAEITEIRAQLAESQSEQERQSRIAKENSQGSEVMKGLYARENAMREGLKSALRTTQSERDDAQTQLACLLAATK